MILAHLTSDSRSKSKKSNKERTFCPPIYASIRTKSVVALLQVRKLIGNCCYLYITANVIYVID